MIAKNEAPVLPLHGNQKIVMEVTKELLKETLREVVGEELDKRIGVSSEKLVHADAVAKHLDIKKDTVRRWAREQKIPGRKRGREWMFILSEVNESMKQGK